MSFDRSDTNIPHIILVVKQPAPHVLYPTIWSKKPVILTANPPYDFSQSGFMYLLDDAVLNPKAVEGFPCDTNTMQAVVLDARPPLPALIERILTWKNTLPDVCLLAHVSPTENLQRLLHLGFDGYVLEEADAACLARISQLQHPMPQPKLPLLNEKRKQIDEIDHQLIDLLAARTTLIHELAGIKKEAGMAALQPARWKEIMLDARKVAKARGVSETLLLAVLEALHRDAVEQQMKDYDAP